MDVLIGIDWRRIFGGMVVVKGSNVFGEGFEFCVVEVDVDCWCELEDWWSVVIDEV